MKPNSVHTEVLLSFCKDMNGNFESNGGKGGESGLSPRSLLPIRSPSPPPSRAKRARVAVKSAVTLDGVFYVQSR